MNPSKTISRYRNLLVICLLLIVALSAALFQANSELNASINSADAQSDPVITPTAGAVPLFRIGQQQFSFDSLSEEFQQPLYQIQKMSFEQQLLVIEQAMIETAIYQQGKPATEQATALRQRFPEISVSDEEVTTYYAQNSDDQTPAFEVLRPQLAEYLLSLKYETAKRELLSQLLVNGEALVLLEAPAQPRSKH